jgi:hypothetical protein
MKSRLIKENGFFFITKLLSLPVLILVLIYK